MFDKKNSDGSSVRLNFVGDISLNGRYINMYKDDINPFETIQDEFKEADYIVANLESFVNGENGENSLKAPRLTATLDSLNYLKIIGIDVACLANNHVYDHLESGFTKTVNFLENNGIRRLGAAKSKKDASKPLILEKNSIKIGLLNYVTRDTNPNLPEYADIKLNYFDLEKVISDIIKLKPKVNHVVLQLHWGGRVEGGSYPDINQPQISKQLIDHGADLIIGHHSHTFQPIEDYKGKYVFYSLGNFCFSDYWFEGKYYALPERRKVTGIVGIDFNKTDYKVNLKFYKNEITHFKKVKTYPIAKLNYIQKNILCYKLLWNIYYLNYKTLLPLTLFLKRKDLTVSDKVKRIVKGVLKRVN